MLAPGALLVVAKLALRLRDFLEFPSRTLSEVQRNVGCISRDDSQDGTLVSMTLPSMRQACTGVQAAIIQHGKRLSLSRARPVPRTKLLQRLKYHVPGVLDDTVLQWLTIETRACQASAAPWPPPRLLAECASSRALVWYRYSTEAPGRIMDIFM